MARRSGKAMRPPPPMARMRISVTGPPALLHAGFLPSQDSRALVPCMYFCDVPSAFFSLSMSIYSPLRRRVQRASDSPTPRVVGHGARPREAWAGACLLGAFQSPTLFIAPTRALRVTHGRQLHAASFTCRLTKGRAQFDCVEHCSISWTSGDQHMDRSD